MHTGFHDGLHWTVDHVLAPELFYRALPILLDEEAVIYFDARIERDESASFLHMHLAPEHLRETVVPTASSHPPWWTGHYWYSPALQKDLNTYFEKWNSPIADNLACYRRGELLLWFHDAFAGGDLQLAGTFAETRVSQFCSAMAPVFRLAGRDA